GSGGYIAWQRVTEQSSSHEEGKQEPDNPCRQTQSQIEGKASAPAGTGWRLRAESNSRRPVVHPTLEGGVSRLRCALVNRSEPLRDALGCEIVGPDKARGPGQRKVLEQPAPSRPRCFGRKALAPKGSIERIDDFRFRPIERVENAGCTDKSAPIDLLADPHA